MWLSYLRNPKARTGLEQIKFVRRWKPLYYEGDMDVTRSAERIFY